MFELRHGHLINKAGKHNYCKPESVQNLIRYIARDRENEDRQEDLLACGAWGCLEVFGTDGVIGGFELARLCYRRKNCRKI